MTNTRYDQAPAVPGIARNRPELFFGDRTIPDINIRAKILLHPGASGQTIGLRPGAFGQAMHGPSSGRIRAGYASTVLRFAGLNTVTIPVPTCKMVLL